MICERQGEQSRPNKRTGKISYSNGTYVANKAKYMVDCDPKHNDYESGERVALVQTSNTLPYFEGDNPSVFGEQFATAVYDFTDTYRAGKKPPKEVVVDRVFSFHPDDDITPEQAIEIAKEAIENVMGPLDDRLSLFAVHQDTKHLHVHFMGSTVCKQGKVFNPRSDDKLWNKEMEALEVKYDLVPVGSREPAKKKKPSGNNKQRESRTGEPSKIEQHQHAIDAAVKQANGDFMDFLTALAASNIIPVANMSNPERVRGCSFYLDGEVFTGTALGTDYRWGTLKKKIGFDADNPYHSQALWQLLQEYEKESKQECSVGEKDTPAPSRELYEDVKDLQEQAPEPHTDLPKPKGTPANQALYRCFKHEYQDGDITYYWKPRKNEAFREVNNDPDHHRMITKNGMNKTVCTGMLQRAKELGWSSIRINGSIEFKANMTELAQRYRIKVLDKDGNELTPSQRTEPVSDWDSLTEREQARISHLARTNPNMNEGEAIKELLPKFLKAKAKLEGRNSTTKISENEENFDT